MPANHENREAEKALYDSRSSAVCIATAYGLEDRGIGVRVPVE
jgi:hypothetical protein